MQSLKKFIAPAGADEGIDRRMVLVVLGFALVAVALLFAVDINRQFMGVLGLLLLVNFVLAWYGILRPAGLMVPILGMAAFTYLIFTNDGLRDTAILGLVVVIIGAGLLTGRRGTVAFGAASLIIVLILAVMETTGRIVNPFSAINTTRGLCGSVRGYCHGDSVAMGGHHPVEGKHPQGTGRSRRTTPSRGSPAHQ